MNEKTYILTFDGGTSYYVDTIMPVVMFETSTDISKAKLFNSITEIESEIKTNSITGGTIQQLRIKSKS